MDLIFGAEYIWMIRKVCSILTVDRWDRAKMKSECFTQSTRRPIVTNRVALGENAKSWHSISVHPFNEACAPRRLTGGRQEGRKKSEVETAINGQTCDKTQSKILMWMPRIDWMHTFSTVSSLIIKKNVYKKKERNRKKEEWRKKDKLEQTKLGQKRRGPPAVKSVENVPAPRSLAHTQHTGAERQSPPAQQRNERMWDQHTWCITDLRASS